jgi:hypothetical protein
VEIERFRTEAAMFRLVTPLYVAIAFSIGALASAQPGPSDMPTTYDVIINGEAFRVEGNRTAKLQSKEKPGVTYEIAIRVSPTQRVRLNTVEFEYELPAKISDDRGKVQRTVQVRHELGVNVLITDLGGPLPAKSEAAVLKALTESLSDSFRKENATDLEVTPSRGKFEGASGLGSKIHYKDASDRGHTCFAYVLSGEKFTLTCVVQYLDSDSEDILPLLKRMFNSFRPAT